MQAISGYLLRLLLTATAAITVGLTFAVWLTQSLRLIDFIVNKGLPLGAFFSFIMLLLPGFLGIVLPIAVFCAVLFVYNKLTTDSELVILRAAGMSQLQVAKPALLLGVICSLIGFAISLYFLPLSYRNFKDLQYEIRNNYSTVLLQEGTFNAVSRTITVYVRERSAGGELRGILVYDKTDPDRPVTMMAETGALVQGENGPAVVMVNGNRQEMTNDGAGFSYLQFDRYTIELSSFTEEMPLRWREPKERYLHELLFPSRHPKDQELKNELIAEGHQRLIQPLYCITFIVVALAFLLSGEFNRRGQLYRVISSVVCIVVIEGLSLAFQDLAIRSLAAIFAMWGTLLLPIAIGLWILLRERGAPGAMGLAKGSAA
jgi:lipopolysaccharide export system permease protein